VGVRLIPLSDPAATELSVAGAKASTLARLAASSPLAIPRSWVIDSESVRELTRRQRTLKESAASALQVAARRAGVVFDGATGYAVRSSAASEDSSELSFAGQFTTVLGVFDERAFDLAVAETVASATSEPVAAYQRVAGVSAQSPFAVLVQEMVPASYSGVAFSMNPLDGANEIVLNSAYGLGEPLVGGEITPDEVVLDAAGTILRVRVGGKSQMRVLTRAGVRSVAVPTGLRMTESITQPLAARLASAVHECLRLVGRPVDVEWAFSSGILFILQVRPATARPSGTGVRQ
jgi:phosphoenolpyruvate synthase/pyruvate phosphate dikinase